MRPGRHDDELRAGVRVHDGLPARGHGDDRHHGQGQRRDVLQGIAAPGEGRGGGVVRGGPVGGRAQADVPDGRRAVAGAQLEGHARVDQHALLDAEAALLVPPLDVDPAGDDVEEARVAAAFDRVAVAELDGEGRPGDGRAGLGVEQALRDGRRGGLVAERAAPHRQRARAGLRGRALGDIGVAAIAAAAGDQRDGRRDQQQAQRGAPTGAAHVRERGHRGAFRATSSGNATGPSVASDARRDRRWPEADGSDIAPATPRA